MPNAGVRVDGRGRRVLDAHLRPVAVELLGDQHREAGPDALAHLGVREQHGDGVVAADAQERVGAAGAAGAAAARRRGARDAAARRSAMHQAAGAARCPSRKPRRMTAHFVTSLQLGAARGASPRGCAGTCRSGRCCRSCAASMSASVGSGFFVEQRGRRHDLARLAVAALHDVGLGPRALHGVRAVRRQALDRRDLARSDASRPGVTQARTGSPSRCTVQAPHCAMPQPNFVPVRPSRSRSTQSSGMSGGAVDVAVGAVDGQFHGCNVGRAGLRVNGSIG